MANVFKKLSLYSEMHEDKDKMKLPSAREHFHKLTEKEASAAYEYMDNAITIFSFVSPEKDPFGSDDNVGIAILTDGEFVWDALLAFCVKKYRVELPQEFLDHVARQKAPANRRTDLDRREIAKAYFSGKDVQVIGLDS